MNSLENLHEHYGLLPQHVPNPTLEEIQLHINHSLDRYNKVFGPKRSKTFQRHLERQYLPGLWFVFFDNNVARFFTRLTKLESPVKNPRSITGSQKFIAKAENNGVLI